MRLVVYSAKENQGKGIPVIEQEEYPEEFLQEDYWSGRRKEFLHGACSNSSTGITRIPPCGGTKIPPVGYHAKGIPPRGLLEFLHRNYSYKGGIPVSDCCTLQSAFLPAEPPQGFSCQRNGGGGIPPEDFCRAFFVSSTSSSPTGVTCVLGYVAHPRHPPTTYASCFANPSCFASPATPAFG